MRYRLRTLLIAVTAFGVLCGVARWWWITPYVMHRNITADGKLTEDWLFKRVFPNGLVQTGSVQYHQNGKKAREVRYGRPDDFGFPRLKGYPRYWLDDGTEVSREEFEKAAPWYKRP